MRLKDRVKNAVAAFNREEIGWDEQDKLLQFLGIDKNGREELAEITYFTCLKMLSETMGKLPLKFYQETDKGRIRGEPDEAARMLMERPNEYMTPATFWATVEYNCEHYGNAYVWIQSSLKRQRYGGIYKVHGFWPMQSQQVDVLVDDEGYFGKKGKIWYQYNDPKTGKKYLYSSDQVMHFKTWFSGNGIKGRSVRNTLKDSIESMNAGSEYLNELYESGMSGTMAIQYTGDMSEERRKKLISVYKKEIFAGRQGKVIAFPYGMTIQPINTKLGDVQFFDLKKYSALQIAAAFGIKPNQINDYEKSSYANSEAQQLAFLVDTMLYRLAQYEQEINYKVLSPKQQSDGCFFKFNEKAILRPDAKTQMEILQTAVGGGIEQINEARRYIDLPDTEGGDICVINGSYVPLTEIGAAYVKKEGGE